MSSIPTLDISTSRTYPCPIAAPTPSKPTACSPLSTLLNLPLSPDPTTTSSSTHPPPVSALIQQNENEEGEEEPELQVKRLELEEAQAALEVVKQQHIIAANKAAIARMEMEALRGPPRPKSSER